MRCSRCTGLIVAEWDLAIEGPSARCVMCGHRPFDPVPAAPPEHHLSKKRVGDRHHCRCGREKVEWRAYCILCSGKKRMKEQRRILKIKILAKQRKGEGDVAFY